MVEDDVASQALQGQNSVPEFFLVVNATLYTDSKFVYLNRFTLLLLHHPDIEHERVSCSLKTQAGIVHIIAAAVAFESFQAYIETSSAFLRNK